MKKLKYFIVIIFMLLTIPNVKANSLSSINIDAYLNKDGSIDITEVWNMTTDKDTEIYKEEYNLGNMNILNFQVRDEKRIYSLVSDWNINASFEDKKNKYGINKTSDGLELCWGISEYGKKTYTISYTLSNSVFNTEDAQVLYLKLINSLDFPPESFNITIRSYYNFSDDLDIWGYGYTGYAYVYNGKIYMSSKENTSLKYNQYAVLLAKFPLNTFQTDNSYSKYKTFNDVYENAEDGTYNFIDNTAIIMIVAAFLVSTVVLIAISYYKSIDKTKKFKFGNAGKKIDFKNLDMFRDIPCQKNIYKAYFISRLYLHTRKENFLGAIFLKWLNEDKIKLHKETRKGIFKEIEVISLDLNVTNQFENKIETDLYNVLYNNSRNGIFNKSTLNYSKYYKAIYSILDDAYEFGRNLYICEGLITQDKKTFNVSDNLKEEAIKVAGLRKYLQEFATMETKQPLEVKLWKEYLMYAQIFGIASQVTKQFKNLYPEIINEMQDYNYNIDDIIILNYFSNSIITDAINYSAGGGGLSSSGGGGGSFGGGGGGSR